jgi:Retrotransposon gag protein
MWAAAQGMALNIVDQQGNAVDRHDPDWIQAALSYLQDDASIWGSLAMEEFANGVVLFAGNWETFRWDFKARFETVDEVVDAKERLCVLWQDSSTVPEYAALFKELMTCTGPGTLQSISKIAFTSISPLISRTSSFTRPVPSTLLMS